MKTKYKKRPISQRLAEAFDEYVIETLLKAARPKMYSITDNIISLLIGVSIGLLIIIPVILKTYDTSGHHTKHQPTVYTVENIVIEQEVEVDVQTASSQDVIQIIEVKPEPKTLSSNDLETFAKCVEAEASGEGEFGKRLVADVILNRVDSNLFPGKTVTEIILQHNEKTGVWQFSVAGNGMLEAAKPTQETYDAIAKELECRSYPGLLYFTSEGFSPYGTPWKKIGGHYFSTAK